MKLSKGSRGNTILKLFGSVAVLSSVIQSLRLSKRQSGICKCRLTRDIVNESGIKCRSFIDGSN